MGAKLTVFISSAVAVSSLFILKSFGGRGVSNWRFIIGQSLLGACEVFSGGLAFEWMGIIVKLFITVCKKVLDRRGVVPQQ